MSAYHIAPQDPFAMMTTMSDEAQCMSAHLGATLRNAYSSIEEIDFQVNRLCSTAAALRHTLDSQLRAPPTPSASSQASISGGLGQIASSDGLSPEAFAQLLGVAGERGTGVEWALAPDGRIICCVVTMIEPSGAPVFNSNSTYTSQQTNSVRLPVALHGAPYTAKVVLNSAHNFDFTFKRE